MRNLSGGVRNKYQNNIYSTWEIFEVHNFWYFSEATGKIFKDCYFFHTKCHSFRPPEYA